MKQTLTIRPATASDIPALVELLKLLFELEQDFVPDPGRQTAALQLMLASPLAAVLVAETDGEVAGFCGAQLLVSTAEGGWSGEVEDLVVAPQWRRRGVGTALLRAVGDWAYGRGAVRMRLNCDDQNLPAMTFYRRHGWEISHLQIWFYHRPDPSSGDSIVGRP